MVRFVKIKNLKHAFLFILSGICLHNNLMTVHFRRMFSLNFLKIVLNLIKIHPKTFLSNMYFITCHFYLLIMRHFLQ